MGSYMQLMLEIYIAFIHVLNSTSTQEKDEFITLVKNIFKSLMPYERTYV